MFAFFGLGLQETLILGIIGAIILVPVIIVFTRLPGSGSRITQLEEENRRLRAELDDQQDRS